MKRASTGERSYFTYYNTNLWVCTIEVDFRIAQFPGGALFDGVIDSKYIGSTGTALLLST
jgi:hypothetical protein